MLRPCAVPDAAMGSCLSILGELRGDACRKECDAAEDGVGRSAVVFGERRRSDALTGVGPPDVADAGVVSCDLLGLELSLSGVGDPLRSSVDDLGGTSGGDGGLAVLTLRDGFAPGLSIGDSGLVIGDVCCVRLGEGPVMQEIIASPNGPDLHAVPGALFDLS
jgi:hypothetical protein